MKTDKEVSNFKADLRRSKKFAMRVYAYVNFSKHDDLILRQHVLAACGFGRKPKMKRDKKSLSVRRETYNKLLVVQNREELVSIIKVLKVGSEMWQAAIRRLKNMLMGKPGWAA